MNEKLLERKLREAIKKIGGEALKFYSPTFTGMPDRLVLLPGGKVWFVELKSTGKRLSPRQRVVSAWLQKLNMQVRVIDSENVLNDFLNEINE